VNSDGIQTLVMKFRFVQSLPGRSFTRVDFFASLDEVWRTILRFLEKGFGTVEQRYKLARVNQTGQRPTLHLPKMFTSLAIAVTAVVGFSACTSTKQPASETRIWYMYSWLSSNGGYEFVLIHKSDNEKFLSNFNPHVPHISGVAKLQQELAKLPRGSGVAWRDYKHIGLIFPPESIRNRIEGAASSHGVIVEIVPTIYD